MREALTLSFLLALSSTAVLLVIGGGLAYGLRKSFPGKRVVESILLLPIALPPTVIGFYLLILLGPAGPIQKVIGVPLAFTFPGMLLGATLFSFPFAFTAFREAFLALDDDLLETARTLGAGRLRIWREIILPLVWPGLLSGALLAFAHTLGEFGVVLMVGGNIPGKTQVASTYIYDLVENLDFKEANKASALMLVLAFSLIFLTRTLEERWRSVTASRNPSASR